MASGSTADAGPDWLRWLLVAAPLASLAAGAIGWTGGTTATDQAVLVARYTARVSLAVFVAGYVWPPISRDRRWLGAFVAAHLIHFAAMVVLITRFPLAPHPHELALGVVAYAWPLAMLIVPGDAQARWRRWGLHYVWLSFAVTYFHRLFVFPDRKAAGAFAFVLLIAALLMRIVAVRRRA